MKSIEEAKEMLGSLKRARLGFYPTPLHKLEAVSEQWGVNLYVKREDFSGITLFGGNKIRKLEYLLGDAGAKGCDTVITYGATQSNHAMQTATAARKCGMKPILYLTAVVEPDKEDVRANLLLDRILGAEVHIIPLDGRTEAKAMEQAYAMAGEHMALLKSQGHKVYNIPEGGSSVMGVCGFISAFAELTEQARDMDIKPEYLFTATGTGGTMAGLTAGRALLGSPVKVVGIQVSKKDETYPDRIVTLGMEGLRLIGAGESYGPEDFEVSPDYYGAGYEIPYQEANDDIRYLAGKEGLFTDPVYSGKAFHGMMDMIRKGRIQKGSTVIFMHTGGATALFSERAIIGDLCE